MLEFDTSKHNLFLGRKVTSSLRYLSLAGCQDLLSREGKERRQMQVEGTQQAEVGKPGAR